MTKADKAPNSSMERKEEPHARLSLGKISFVMLRALRSRSKFVYLPYFLSATAKPSRMGRIVV